MATEASSLHAWYSAASAEANGFAVYLSTLDQEVFVTEVREESTPHAKWPGREVRRARPHVLAQGAGVRGTSSDAARQLGPIVYEVVCPDVERYRRGRDRREPRLAAPRRRFRGASVMVP